MFKDTDVLGQTLYKEKDKIDDLYSKQVDAVIKQFSTELKRSYKLKGKAGLSLGSLLSFLGIGVEIGGSVSDEHAISTQVISELGVHEKLLIAINALEKINKVSDLNSSLSTHATSVKPYVYFSGNAKFVQDDEEPDQCIVRGNVENKQFEAYCSKGYMLDSLRKGLSKLHNPKPVFCFGNIIEFERDFTMTFYYIGGSIDDIPLQ